MSHNIVSNPEIKICEEESEKEYATEEERLAATQKRVDGLKQFARECKKNSSISYRGQLFWAGIENERQFLEHRAQAEEEYKNGTFFLDRIGRYRSVDPQLTLTVLNIRQEWIMEYGVRTIPEFMLLDFASTAYFHFVRLNETVNSVMANIEFEMFAIDTPHFNPSAAKTRRDDELKDRSIAERLAYHLQTVLQPILDQYNRAFIRNLKALRDLRRGNIQLNIGSVGQMNVGEQQLNVKIDETKKQ